MMVVINCFFDGFQVLCVYLVKCVEFVGVICLLNIVFQNVGIEVMMDIVVLWKLVEGEKVDIVWVEIC